MSSSVFLRHRADTKGAVGSGRRAAVAPHEPQPRKGAPSPACGSVCVRQGGRTPLAPFWLKNIGLNTGDIQLGVQHSRVLLKSWCEWINSVFPPVLLPYVSQCLLRPASVPVATHFPLDRTLSTFFQLLFFCCCCFCLFKPRFRVDSRLFPDEVTCKSIGLCACVRVFVRA